MDINWKEVARRYADLEAELSNPMLEVNRRREVQQEHRYLKQLLEAHAEVVSCDQQIASVEASLQTEGLEMRELFFEELESLKLQKAAVLLILEDRLFPADPLDDRSVFLEIRAGTGGQEAALFAGDLLRMYSNYALSKGWNASLVDSSSTDLGGVREVTLHIEGKGVYAHLKHESGVHRVQRVPRTEASGRIHTSTATIAVLPEAEEVDVQINPADLRIDTYRAGGAGGQHVNKTDSAVRITHIPTGIVVACQDERSQHKNRAKAMKVLQSRMLAAQQEKKEMELSQQRKEMVGAGTRSEKVRTYNFPQNRVTDHQVDVTLKKLDVVMEGALDELIEPLMAREKQERRKHPILKK